MKNKKTASEKVQSGKEYFKDQWKRFKFVFNCWWKAPWYDKPFILVKNYWLYLIFEKPLPKPPEEPFEEFPLVKAEEHFKVCD